MKQYIPQQQWLWRWGELSLLFDKRQTYLKGKLLLLIGLAIFLALLCGTLSIAPQVAWTTLTGHGPELETALIFDVRLPRIIATFAAGLALGMSGAMIQNLFRNRLASPEILGINEGATLAIVSYVLYTAQASWPFWAAPIGALIATGLLYALSQGTAEQGYLFLICGLCLTEFLRAIVEFAMSIGALHEVQNIYIWLQGSFIGQGYQSALPVLIAVGLSLPVSSYLSSNQVFLALSPQVAQTLGFPLARFRLVTILLAVAFAALGTAIGGPISFVAMAAPMILTMLSANQSPSLFNAGLMGSLLLILSDTLARSLAQPYEIAAGVLTKILGGFFLFVILLKSDRR